MSRREWIMLAGCAIAILAAVAAGKFARMKKAEITWQEMENKEPTKKTTDQKNTVPEQGPLPSQAEKNGVTIAIDCGHGGFDPGKISCVPGILEKDINLAIGLKLKDALEEQGYSVCITRQSDIALCEEGSSHKKRDDMAKRISIINESGAALAISIHQNSFPSPDQRGAQVFYYAGSEEGKNLALKLQSAIKTTLNDGNRREAKENDSYYLLKHTNCPTVIVECGFLSNTEETEKLCTDDYQALLVEGILEGIKEQLAS